MVESVTASWLRRKMSIAKRRVKGKIKAKKVSNGQRVLPKPSVAQISREREEDAAKRIFALAKGGR